MDQIDYYFIYLCLCHLVIRKKVSRNVANKILKEYETECRPFLKHEIT
ncbi:hypothetical protein ATF84_101287 [[Clostridium] innocuum]|nr:hypothetical protein ATF84_101287 [[Clostridium] innocuum]SSA37465.1 hypothetical protein SAMN04487929_101287 [[Clostridium] innocuum]